jgi:hypothetical protein
MSMDKQENSAKGDFDEWDHRPLKSVSIESVEAAFASALKSLTGTEYKVKINSVNFNPDQSAWYMDKAQMEIITEKVVSNPFGSTKSEAQEK